MLGTWWDVQQGLVLVRLSGEDGRSDDGRKAGYVVLSNGVRVSCGNRMSKMLGDICEAQIVQRRAGELAVRVVRGADYDGGSEGRLVREMRKRLGTDTSIRVEYVQALQRSPTGKLRLVVSEVAKERFRMNGRDTGRRVARRSFRGRQAKERTEEWGAAEGGRRV